MSDSIGDYLMHKSFLLSIFLAAGSLSSMAEGFASVNIGNTTGLWRDILEGEYSRVAELKICFSNIYQNCYFTDYSQFTVTLNGTRLDPVASECDENGLPHALIFPLSQAKQGENTYTYTVNAQYVNKDEEDFQEKTVTYNEKEVNFTLTDYSTFESADRFVRSDLPHHTEKTKFQFNNPPGEYNVLLGDYGFDFSDIYTQFYPSPNNRKFRPYVINNDGKLVCYCTEKINRDLIARDDNTSFHVSIDEPITAPGSYWIIFISEGDYRYYDTKNGYYNIRHLAKMKLGPYVVTGNVDGENPPTAAPVMTEWHKETFESDALPLTLTGGIENASAITCRQATASNYSTNIVYGDTSTPVKEITISDTNKFSLSLPDNWYKGPGEYKAVITAPNDIFNAITNDGKIIRFADDQQIEMPFSVNEPTLPESLDFYVRSASSLNYEIADGETINVRLMHDDQALGMKIFVKWTGEQSTLRTMDTDSNGYLEHTEDIEIASPGRLEYYTTRGNSTSPVKTIIFTPKATSAVESPEYVNSVPAEEGLYDLRGIRVNGIPLAGIYIRRNADGTTRKVIIR